MQWALAAGCWVNPMRARPAVVPRDLTLALQAVLFDPIPAVLIVLMHSPSLPVAVAEQKRDYPSSRAAAAQHLDPSCLAAAAVAARPSLPVAVAEQKRDYPILLVAAAHRQSFPTPELVVGQARPMPLAVAEGQKENPILLRLPHRAEEALPMPLAAAEK